MRREFLFLKDLEVALREMKEEGLSKKDSKCEEEFATLKIVDEILKLYTELTKQPNFQVELLRDYEDKQRMGVVYTFQSCI